MSKLSGHTLWFYHPNVIDHREPCVTFRGVRWRRTAPYLLAASAVFVGIQLAEAALTSQRHPSPIVAAVFLFIVAGIAWLGDVTRHSLILDRSANTYELVCGWPWSFARRGDFAELLRLRLEIERYPRRSWAVLRPDGKWLVPRPAWGHRGWLVLYLDIQGETNLAFQLQCSALPPPSFPGANEATAAMRQLLHRYSEWLRLPAVDETSAWTNTTGNP